VNDALRFLGHVVLVRDQDDGVAAGGELAEEIENFAAGLRVEVSGRLVGQQQRRLFTNARAMATRWR